MSDPGKPPPPPLDLPPPPPVGSGLGWFMAISGGVMLFLTLGCILAVNIGNSDGGLFLMAVIFGLPTLILGSILLWLGRRRLQRARLAAPASSELPR